MPDFINSQTDKEYLLYWKNSKEKWVPGKRNIVPALKTQSNYCRQTLLFKAGTLRTHKADNGFRAMKDNICPCIPARARQDGSGQPVIFNGARVRRLTPLECFRLQGFPDEIVKIANEINIPETQQYKIAGNSVSVNVVYEIAKKIVELDRKYKNG